MKVKSDTIVITFIAPRKLAKRLTTLTRQRQDEAGDLRKGRGKLIVELIEKGLRDCLTQQDQE